jgi:hypothetical protein
MKTIHLILSPLSQSQEAYLKINMKSEDFIVYVDNVELSVEIKKVAHALSSYKIDSVEPSKKLFGQILSIKHNDVKNRVWAYSELSCNYVLSYLFEVSGFIEQFTSSGDLIVVYSAKCYGNNIPIAGLKTRELQRGSSLLLGAFIASKLTSIFNDRTFHFKRRLPDLFCFSSIRLFMLTIIDLLSLANLLRKVSYLRLKSFRLPFLKKKATMFIVRVPHQIYYAKEIALQASDRQFSMFVLPQARQGAARGIYTALSHLPNNIHVYTPKVTTLFNMMFLTFYQHIKMKIISARTQTINAEIKLEAYSININIIDIYDETTSLLSDTFYSNLISEHLRKYKGDMNSIISFALKGRYAVFEYLSAKREGVPLDTVQTASLDSAPSAIFPLADRFFTDSAVTAQEIKNNGFLTGGKLLYKGCPFKIHKVSPVIQLAKITFFTQPYEVEVTRKAITLLANWAKINGSMLLLRLHPRDSKSNYQDIIDLQPTDVAFDSSTSSEVAIVNTDLCISRTSSVILESIALGVPVVTCLLSSYDRECSISFIKLLKSFGGHIEDGNQLLHKLDNPTLIIETMEILQSRLYSLLDIHDLTNALTCYYEGGLKDG